MPASDLIDVYPFYDYLAPTEPGRQERYEQFVSAGIPDNELRLIREAINRCQLTGGGRFIDEVERITGARLEMRGQGKTRTREK